MNIIYFGLIVRIFFAYIFSIYTFSFSENDALRYSQDAILLSEGNFEIYIETFSYLYTFFLAILYKIFTKSLFLGNFSSVILWFISAIVLFKTLKLIQVKKQNIILVLLFYSFLPSSIIFTSLTLKEALMLTLINILVYLYFKIILSKNKFKYVLMFVINNFIILFVHKVFFVIFFIIYLLLFINRKTKLITLILLIFLIAIFYILFLERFIEILNIVHTGQYISRATYYQHEYFDKNILSFIYYIFISYINYNIQPTFFNVENFFDVVVFFENLLRISLIFLSIFILIKNYNQKSFRHYLFLFLLFICIELLWASGTQNWGTAIRHHLPSFGILLILSFVDPNNKKFFLKY